MEIGVFSFFSDIIILSTSAEITEDKKKENRCEQLSMYRVNPSASQEEALPHAFCSLL